MYYLFLFFLTVCWVADEPYVECILDCGFKICSEVPVSPSPRASNPGLLGILNKRSIPKLHLGPSSSLGLEVFNSVPIGLPARNGFYHLVWFSVFLCPLLFPGFLFYWLLPLLVSWELPSFLTHFFGVQLKDFFFKLLKSHVFVGGGRCLCHDAPVEVRGQLTKTSPSACAWRPWTKLTVLPTEKLF